MSKPQTKPLNYGSIHIPTDTGPRTGLVTYGYTNRSDLAEWVDSHKSRHWSPEQNLMLAILEYAVQEAQWNAPAFKSTKQKREHEKTVARAWIADPEENWTFSFIHICECLHLSPTATRKRIQAGYRKKAA